MPFYDEDTEYSEERESICELELIEKISQAEDQISIINEELKLICEISPNVFSEMAMSGVGHSCSLFVENSLYPQFSIYVDTSKLIHEIKEMSLRIVPNNVLSPRVIVSEDSNLNADIYKLCANDTRLDCEISSAITSEGVFWLHLISCDDVDFQSTTTQIPLVI